MSRSTEAWAAAALEAGFSHAGPLNMSALKFLPEVRSMCAADRCQSYGRNWMCPPGCGTLEDAAARAAGYRRGILLQSTGQLEDDFDVETMMDTEAAHKERFKSFTALVRGELPGCLPMAAGTCTICRQCTYPDAPCRFPERAIPSMEAYGLFVSQVCQDSGMAYYYGPRTITYTSCILLD
mgnify:FL=1